MRSTDFINIAKPVSSISSRESIFDGMPSRSRTSLSSLKSDLLFGVMSIYLIVISFLP